MNMILTEKTEWVREQSEEPSLYSYTSAWSKDWWLRQANTVCGERKEKVHSRRRSSLNRPKPVSLAIHIQFLENNNISAQSQNHPIDIKTQYVYFVDSYKNRHNRVKNRTRPSCDAGVCEVQRFPNSFNAAAALWSTPSLKSMYLFSSLIKQRGWTRIDACYQMNRLAE